MPDKKPSVSTVPDDSTVPSDHDSVKSKGAAGSAPPVAPALATHEGQRAESVLGDWILRFLRIRRGPKKEVYDLDAVCIWILPIASNQKVLIDPDRNPAQYMGLGKP